MRSGKFSCVDFFRCREFAGLEKIDDPLSRLFAAMDALGHSDTVVGVSGKEKSRQATERIFDLRDSLFVTDVVLRHGVLLPADVHQQRFTSDTQQLSEFFGGDLYEFIVRQIRQFRLAGAADKGPHQDFALGSAAWVFDAGETA